MQSPITLLNKTDPSGIALIIDDQVEAQLLLQNLIEKTFTNLKIVSLNSVDSAKDWIKSRQELKDKESLVMALVDLGLPDGSGCEVISTLSKFEPDTSCVVVTIYDDDVRLFKALEAGASGYLLKDDGPELMATLLQRMQQGEPALSPAIARSLLGHFRAPKIESQPSQLKLSAREIETLTLISRGLTVAECAKELSLSAQTVAGYVKTIYQKLHVSNRAEATREAIRLGLK